MLLESFEIFALLPLLAIPAAAAVGGGGAAAGGALGLGGIMTGLSGALGSIPIIGGLFGGKKDSQQSSLTNMQNLIGSNNVMLSRAIKTRYGKEQQKNYVVFALLAIVAGLALFFSLRKK